METEPFFAALGSRLAEAREADRRRHERFFSELAPRLDAARSLDRELDRQLARRFNVFNYLRTDELGLSRVIADLLDSGAGHGQGTLFLRALLEGLNQFRRWPELDACRSSAVVEHRIPSGRKIDVVVRVVASDQETWCLATENKPYAGDQESQVRDYLEYLEKEFGERFLLLQPYIASTGHAMSNLYFGPATTRQLEAALEFETDTNDVDTYRMRLVHAAGDSLIFAEECLSFRRSGFANSRDEQLGAGHKETLIGSTADGEGPSAPTARVFRYLLNWCRVFHFHDTGPASRVRSYCYVGADRWPMSDAGNLAAVLYRLRTDNPGTYHGIVETIRQVAPFLTGFDLEPTGAGGKDIILNWRHRECDLIFGPHQLSDGTLRAICLISLLMLPTDELPLLIVIDEPELGLHPYALDILAPLCRSASVNSQILISTQSSALVNKFEPKDIVVIERDGESSGFVRPDAGDLESWLEDYSLGEIWEKNVIGGGPH